MRKYRFQCWHVAFRKHKDDIFNNNDEFIIIPNTFRYWAADPFVIFKDGIYYIFAELYDKILRKGRLGYCKVSVEGKILSKWKMTIKSSVHMSFPNPVIVDGQLLLMPESGKEFELRYYEPIRFPDKWRIKEKLLEGIQVCDTIELGDDYLWAYDDFTRDKKALIYKKGSNQSYVCIKEIPDNDCKLRPAGKAFEINGQLIVPLQNCDGEYGKSIFFNRIIFDKVLNDIKTDVVYEMSNANVIIHGLNEDVIGMHTYNFDNELEVIDYKTRVFTWGDICGLLLSKFRK